MAVTATIRKIFQAGTDQVDVTITPAGVDGIESYDVTIPASSSDLNVAIAIAITTLKALYISVTGDMTLETNSSGSPVQSFVMKSGYPITWEAAPSGGSGYPACPITTAITTLYVTSTAGGVLTIRVARDSTP